MYNETFTEKHELGLVALTGSNRALYYCNEQEVETEEGVSYQYDVYEVSSYVNPLAAAKSDKIAAIDEYDKSISVNSFKFNGKRTWKDKYERASMMNSVNIQKAKGEKKTTLWFVGKPYVIDIDKAIAMLSELEIYAFACLNVTEQHKARVNELTDIEAVLAYDYTAGYPEKLSF